MAIRRAPVEKRDHAAYRAGMFGHDLKHGFDDKPDALSKIARPRTADGVPDHYGPSARTDSLSLKSGGEPFPKVVLTPLFALQSTGWEAQEKRGIYFCLNLRFAQTGITRLNMNQLWRPKQQPC